MSAFDLFLSKAKDTAKKVTNKSGEIIEIAKLNLAVTNEEDKIEKVYTEIGKKLYGTYCAGQSVDQDIKNLCEEVDDEEARVRMLKRKIGDLKQTSFCKSCGAVVKKDALFCPKCGIRL